jgi:ankyrin repeat protein
MVCCMKRTWARLVLPITFVYFANRSAVAAEKDLLAALKDGDAPTARRLIESGASPNATDEFNTSALMYAAVYSDVDTIRMLLDRGADPNHADNAGATALMWSIPDEQKVRLLVARGANVNAVSSLTGRTPLLIAAGRPGAAPIVRLLLDKGAHPKARDRQGLTTVIRAAYDGDLESVKLLLDRGVDINARGAGFTALLWAVNRNDEALVDLLLKHGADVKAQDDDGLTVLVNATSYANITIFRKLTANGADPRWRGPLGLDLLTAAAASDTSRPEVVRQILKMGCDAKQRSANLHTMHGYGTEPEGPFDWASRHGDTPVTRLLAEVTSASVNPGNQPTDSPRLGAATPRQAISAALPLLYDASAEFFKRSGCTSCHHNVLPAIAFAAARSAGIFVNSEKVRRNYLQSAAWVNGNREAFFQDVRFAGGATTVAYLLWGLDSDRHDRDRATDAAIHHLAGSQSINGAWRVRSDRPPIESGGVAPTALSIRALRTYMIPGRKAEFERRIRRASKWLAEYPARTGEEKAMRLLGLVSAGANAESIRTAATTLAADQRKDGGWAQLSTLSSDAYATGQALYALQAAGRLTRASLANGTRFLLRTQLADGSWHVRSRAFPIQPNYFDTGFPHGRDQWISAAATSWACIGLSLAVEPVGVQR